MPRRPRLAVTLGDPRGIGPEIVAKMLKDVRVAKVADIEIVGPSGTPMKPDHDVGAWTDDGPSALAGELAGKQIERAVALAASGKVDGIVTAPIDKSVLLQGGYDYPGHTEMLASLTGSKVAMMLTSPKLRVVLATMHVPLRDVPALLTRERILDAVTTTRTGLRDWFAVADARIALCALNPHAGDKGRFGDEDDRLLAPAAKECGALGPFSADTVFVRAMRGEFDAVIAPYHDVGMTAIKVAAFGHAVNVTLGLPFPRTSPDHGTALDIANKGIADASSMVEATMVCAQIAARLAK